MDKFILVFRIMKDLNVGIKKAQEMAESLIQQGEKVWNGEKIIMSEKEKHKFLHAFIGIYGEMAEDFVRIIK